MKRLSWKYLAGLIDGEGCIDLAVTKVKDQHYIQPRVRIGMAVVAEDLILNLQNNFGGHLTRRESKNVNWSDSISWALIGYKSANPFLRNITNHLILKKEQARFCIWMETNLHGRRLSQEVIKSVKKELTLMKRDPHRLSEKAQDNILGML